MTARVNPLTETKTRTRPSRYSKGDWRIVECLETGMVFLENPPTYQDLADDLAWEKTYQAEKERRRRDEPVLSRISDVSKKQLVKRPRKIERLPADFLKSLPEAEKPRDQIVMLDVGCGVAKATSVIAELLQNRMRLPVTAVGIEISNEQAKVANERLSQFGGGYCIRDSGVGGMERIEDGFADLIVLCSYLEHETQPLPLLQLCRQKLKPFGAIVIKVPNFACLNRRIRQTKWCGFRYPDHVNYFTPATLREIIQRAGLKVARMGLTDRFPLNDNMYAVACRER